MGRGTLFKRCRGLKALVVDDEDIQRDLMTKTLRVFGFNTFTAHNAFEGLEKFREEKPDILVTDLFMPGWNGIELARKVLEIDPDIPLIIMTGSPFDVSDFTSSGARISSVLKKPFTTNEVEIALEKALDEKDEIQAKTK